jgi:transposase
MSGYLDIVGEIVRCKNRLKAVFRSEALCTRSNQFYSQKERATELSHDSARFVAEQFFDHIEYLENRKQEYKYWFKENKNKYRPIRNLMTIPGINLVRANIITAIVCMPHRFKNKHQFWGYCMLVRHIQQSGGRIYGNKRAHGRGELRNAFIGAAENAMRSTSCLRDHYDALRARGVKHKEAKLALARHIASIALSLLKNNETYQDDYLDKQRERTKLRKTLNLNRY